MRTPSVERLLLFATVLFAGLVSLPQELSLGAITGLGAVSMLTCGAAWLMWLSRPRLGHRQLAVLVPLVLFAVFSAGSLLWTPANFKGLQLLCVVLGFIGLVLLTTREVEDDPALAKQLQRALDVATWFAVGVYSISLVRDGLGAETIMLARPFALFVLLGVARQLAIWLDGDRRGLLGAAIILAVLLGSISRTALAAGLMMVPLAALVRGRRNDFVFAFGSVALGIVGVAAALALSPTIYERFFGFDNNMQLGGVAINSSGRMEMWEKLWESAVKTPILGQGPGSSSNLIDFYFPFPGVGHPHNDYLRLFHDFGLLGLGLWAVFQFGACGRLFKQAREDARGNIAHHGCHLVPLLGLIGLAVSMFTDNALGYAFVMYPLAVMIGCSLGLTSDAPRPVPVTAGVARPPTIFGAARRRLLLVGERLPVIGSRPEQARLRTGEAGSAKQPL